MVSTEDLPDIAASIAETKHLFEVMEPWALRLGKVVTELSDVNYGEHKGIRIAIHPIRHEYTMPGNVLRAILPQVVATLAIGPQLTIHYQPAFYQSAPLDYCYFNSCTSFAIKRDAESLKPSETIYIEGPDARLPYTTSRMHDDSRLHNDHLLTPEAGSTDWDAPIRKLVAFEAAIGGNGMARSELEAFEEIALNLDRIHDAITNG